MTRAGAPAGAPAGARTGAPTPGPTRAPAGAASAGARGAARALLQTLSRPGPHEVLRGDLRVLGMPGAVFTPASGTGLPAIAFGHGWLQPTYRYEELLRHLASWGVVVAAPGTQCGLAAGFREFAADLRAVLDGCVRARLGDGALSVDPDRLGLAGHGAGGGCAVLAAAAEQRCRAVATLALAEVLPSPVNAARAVRAPGMHLVAGADQLAPGHAWSVARAWAGPVQLRTLPKASHFGFLHGGHWTDLLLPGRPEYSTRWISRSLLTAFLLRHLTGATEYDPLLECDLRKARLELLRG